MEETGGKANQKLLSSSQTGNTNTDMFSSGHLAPGLNLTSAAGGKPRTAESTTERLSNIGNVETSEDNISCSSSSTSEEDYVSASSEDDQNGYVNISRIQTTNGGIKNTQNRDVKDSAVNDDIALNVDIDKSDHLGLNKFSFLRPEQPRPRSLSKISEGSRTSYDHETKDDLHLPTTIPGRDSALDIHVNSSLSNLATIDHGHSYDQRTTVQGVQPSHSHLNKVFSQKEVETPRENNNVIVSGNIGSNAVTNKSDTTNRPRIHISPVSKFTALNPTEVASESTPKPTDAAFFKFPAIKPDPTKSTFGTSLSPGNTENLTSSQPSLTSSNDNRMIATKGTTILAEATVHDTESSPSEVPMSLKNLVFLTKSETSVLAAPESNRLTVINPGFLTTNEGKRSNLKKKSVTSTTASAFPSTLNANNSIDGSSNSLNILGTKKSIKWYSDIPDTKKAHNEQQTSMPQDVSKPQGQLSSKEGVFSRDSSRKISPGLSSGIMDKKDSNNTPMETQDSKDNKANRRDTTAMDDPEKGKEKDRTLSRANSGYSGAPGRTSGNREPGGNLISRALRGLKGKGPAAAEDKRASYIDETDQDIINMSIVSSSGLSTPGDVTPKDYLTDAEDTVTSFDEVERRDKKAGTPATAGSSTKAAESTSLHELGTAPDDVERPPSVTLRNPNTRTGFLTESLRNSLVVILSGIYGITLIVLGLVLPLSETFTNPDQPYYFEIFYLYLYTISMVFLVYVYTYLLRKERTFLLNLPRTISRTLSRTFSRTSMRSRTSVASDKGGSVVSKPLVRQNSNLSAISLRRRRKIAYNSEVSNHTGSFYLRVGVIGFGIGSMIHSGLTFGHYFEVSHLDNHCSDAIQAIKPLAHLCFTFVQMYFIFMNSKMCVHKYKTLARFGLMHMSCANICVWLRSVVVQTLQVIKVDQRQSYNAMVHANEHRINSEDDSEEREPIQTLEEYMEEHKTGSMSEINCRWDSMLGQIVESSSVYLYPCIIEYSLVCACVLYVMWSNVGEGYTPQKRMESCSDYDTLDSDGESDDESAHHRMSVDCAASSRGLFLGILLLVAAVVCVVCFYVLTSVSSHVTVGILLGHISEELILIVAFIATAIAAFQMRRMRFSGKRKVGIEEILTLISISGLGLYGIWSTIAAVFYLDTLHGRLTLVTNLFMLVQAGSQATFTLAALRASARNHEQLREKPGRQCVTFLLICNFALWVVNTFETQRIEYNQTQVNFYGNTAWAIFSHISVPLGIYFRFHSTVNLSIVWKKAWKKTDPQDKIQTHGQHST